MTRRLLAPLLLTMGLGSLHAAEPPAPHGPVPTEQQVQWLRMEWYAFVHFGLNTWTNREWGYGDESPALFNPARFDANAMVRHFREAGMSGMIYTAKHHDGWCAWPTSTTSHSIKASPWKDGKGDVVREFADACTAQNIAFGVYISPWDRNHTAYGKPEYLQDYYKQVEELLTQYGPIFEIWFDGANGGDGYYGGARTLRHIGNATQYYNYPVLVQNIRSLQPHCIIWGAGELGDVEWGGSEKGHVPYPCKNVRLVHGEPRWISLEGDTPINRAGWFWHPGQEKTVKSPEQLMQVYMDSVGRGANLILNLAPNREGELDAADVASLQAFGKMRQELLSTDYALGARASASEVRGEAPQFAASNLTDGDIESYWCPEDGTTTAEVIIQLPAPQTFDVIRLREQIRLGQRVESFEIDACIDNEWQTVDAGGRSIGNQVLRRLKEPITANRLRLRITSALACPCISEFSLLRMPGMLPQPDISRRGEVLMIHCPGQQHIVYTLDGRKPTADSPRYHPGIRVEAAAVVRAACYDAASGQLGPVATMEFGYNKTGWSSTYGSKALDDDASTLWQAEQEAPALVVDMKQELFISEFSYLPRQDGSPVGIVDRYRMEMSDDGIHWETLAEGEFSNIRANPVAQRVWCKGFNKARYWRFTPLSTLDGSPATAAEIEIFGIGSKKVERNIHFNR